MKTFSNFFYPVSSVQGKIGIELVQYRGHAMISFVSPESPLVGWIFPTDILIAIDEIPVSGLRVRDIVKILTERADSRQRSLRLISSHAMAELTQSASVDIS
jgi:predicted metalloprotease with PDZ domain